MDQVDANYYLITTKGHEFMLLYSLPSPGPTEQWILGRKFKTPVKEPVVVEIQTDYEDSLLLPFYDVPQIMRNDFYETLVEAGVDNIDVYDVIIQSEDGTINIKGYKAYNVIGTVKAANLQKTVFHPDESSRTIDASITELVLDETKTSGLLMFRLVENVGALFVHRKVKEAIENKKFPNVDFRLPSDFLSL